MQFLWPSLLWSLLLVPVLVAIYILVQRRRRRYALRYSSISLIKLAMTPGSKWRRHIPAAVFFLGLAVLLSALARPQSVVIVPQDAQTIILAIDVSGSMRTRDIDPSRIEAAKAAASAFVREESPQARIGVVAFSGTASIVQQPTIDHDLVQTAISRLTLERSTAIGSGLIASLNAIYGNIFTDTFGGAITISPGATITSVPEGTHAPSTIILLTDGANVQGPSPRDAAEKAADLGVRVFTIGVGNPNSSSSRQPDNQPQGASPSTGGPNGGFGGGFNGGSPGRGFSGRFEVDETTLKGIAETTDGEYFLATDANALKDVYQKLKGELVFVPVKTEVTSYFTAIGAALTILAITLSVFLFNRVL